MKIPKLDNVSSTYGAPMGRRDSIMEPDTKIKFSLRAMRMVDGDYDEGGAYWGAGNSQIGWMYHAIGEGVDYINEMFIRAKNREDAKRQVLEVFENAKFYR